MANIFLSQALQAAGKPIVSALAQKSYEQQKFKQMQNALLAEFQELEARELNLLATQKRMENASEQLPENLNKLNALVEMSATGQVDPNTVGKAAAELALANKNLGTTKNALSAELQDIQRKKQFLQTQPVLRAIMSGDVKTEAGLAGISAVQYPSEKPKEYDFEVFTVGGTDMLVRTTKSGEIEVLKQGEKSVVKGDLEQARLRESIENEFYDRWRTHAKPIVDTVLQQYGLKSTDNVLELMKGIALGGITKDEAGKLAGELSTSWWANVKKEADKIGDPSAKQMFIDSKRAELALALESAALAALDDTRKSFPLGSVARELTPYLFAGSKPTAKARL